MVLDAVTSIARDSLVRTNTINLSEYGKDKLKPTYPEEQRDDQQWTAPSRHHSNHRPQLSPLEESKVAAWH